MPDLHMNEHMGRQLDESHNNIWRQGTSRRNNLDKDEGLIVALRNNPTIFCSPNANIWQIHGITRIAQQ